MFLNTLGYKTDKAIGTVRNSHTVISKKGKHNSSGKRKWSATIGQENVKTHILSFEPGMLL